MATTIVSQKHHDTHQALLQDFWIQQMAAEWRVAGFPSDDIDRPSDWALVQMANDYYDHRGGEITDRYVGAVYDAIDELATRTPSTLYALGGWFSGEDDMHVVTFDAVTLVELALHVKLYVQDHNTRLQAQTLRVTANRNVVRVDNDKGRSVAEFAINHVRHGNGEEIV